MKSKTVKQVSPVEFDEKFKKLHDHIFVPNAAWDSPLIFVDATWEKILLEGGLFQMTDCHLDALFESARERGDSGMIVTDFETIPPHQMTVCVRFDRKEIQHLRGTHLSHFDYHVFGFSGTWGMIRYIDDYSYLGGTTEFMQTFIRFAGGRAELKKEFLAFAASGWDVTPSAQLKILRNVGWSFRDLSEDDASLQKQRSSKPIAD